MRYWLRDVGNGDVAPVGMELQAVHDKVDCFEALAGAGGVDLDVDCVDAVGW